MLPTLKGKNCTLRPYTMEDAMAVFTAINSKTIMKNTTIPLPWKLDFAAWWISFIKAQEQKRPMPEFHFVIEYDGSFSGTVGVINIDEHKKGEMGYWMVDRFAGHGLMTEAVTLVSQYALEKQGLQRVFSPVMTFNKASSRVLEKSGFTLEGTLKNQFLKNGKGVDAWLYAKVKG